MTFTVPTGIAMNLRRAGHFLVAHLPTFKTRRWWTVYDHLVYNLDILVPEPDPEKMESPDGFYVQEVLVGKKVRWRVMKDQYHKLDPYLREGTKHRDSTYTVLGMTNSWILDQHSSFIKKWDALMFALLVFTALVIPFETAYVLRGAALIQIDRFTATDGIEIDVAFLINRIMDILFFADMFVQCLRAFRDERTGEIVVCFTMKRSLRCSL